ncbi:MAG: beta-glucosidase [Acidobacteriota bacterium]|nr:beta-glucosidase [Acidobacteriota bacterium]
MRFPDGFLWGAATAAYQIEGAASADGRGVSIWDTFSRRPGAVHNGDTGDVACDHYHRMDGDLDLLAELGVSAYRFSIAWPRVQPTGKGPAHQPGLDFYRRLVDGLRARGISPVATLYHWDLPQPLEDAGGWGVRETAERFADYAALAGQALGDGVDMWITLNEPWCSSWLGYGSGRHAPGVTDVGRAGAANHHLLLGHGMALPALRAEGAARVGITLNLAPVRAATDHPDDVAAAQRVDGNQNRLFTEPLLEGRYPTDMLEHYARHRPGFSVVADGDLDLISAPMDFLGVNYYFPAFVVARGREAEALRAGFCVAPREADAVADDLGVTAVHRSEQPRTLMGWEVDAPAMRDLLTGLSASYRLPPVYVTENGASFSDYQGPDGVVHDGERSAYLDTHLRAVRSAMTAGVDIRGYFVWSLLDNFEWGHGYSKRFGLVWVDYPSGGRLPKDSFRWYQTVVATNELPAPPAAS